jgi:ketosteroid isomerase-like protein
MVKTWTAALIGVAGLAIGAVAGPHVLAASANDSGSGGASLADRVAIEDMVTRYYGNFGKKDAADDFATFYTADATFDVNGIVSKGQKGIEAFYTDTSDDAEAPAAQGTFHMMLSNPIIDVKGNTATARFMWTGVMNTAIDARPQLWEQGREYDLLVKQDGQWRIKKRVVIADSGLPTRYKATYTPRVDYDVTKE